MKLQALIVFHIKLSNIDAVRIRVFWDMMLECWVSGF